MNATNSDMVATPLGKEVWARLFGYVDAQIGGELHACELSEIRTMTKDRKADVLISRFRRTTEVHSPGEWLYSPFFIALRSGRDGIDKRALRDARWTMCDGVLQDARRLLWKFGHGSRLLLNARDGIDFFGQAGFPREAAPDLPQVFEARARTLAEAMGLETVDFEAYSSAAMVRADGTRDPVTGLHRIRLPYQDIQEWTGMVDDKARCPEEWYRWHQLEY